MSIITNILSWIGDLFRAIPKELREKAEIALSVTNKILYYTDSDVANFLVSITPTTLDDKALLAFNSAMKYITNWLGAMTEDEIPGILQNMHPEMRNAALIKMASNITAYLDGNDIENNRYDLIAQAVYSKGK